MILRPENSKTHEPLSIRHAEKNRKSSCSFADRVAHLAIDEYRRYCPADVHYQQTVLSAFLVEIRSEEQNKYPCNQLNSDLFVVAFGVGTKVPGYEQKDFNEKGITTNLCENDGIGIVNSNDMYCGGGGVDVYGSVGYNDVDDVDNFVGNDGIKFANKDIINIGSMQVFFRSIVACFALFICLFIYIYIHSFVLFSHFLFEVGGLSRGSSSSPCFHKVFAITGMMTQALPGAVNLLN